MKPLKRFALGLVGVGLTLLTTQVFAEDTKGKWQFGFGISYYSTVDYIRSNADIALATGAVGQCGEGTTLCPVGSTDDRPDINIMNQPSIRDDFKLDFNASYGLTRWLALEAAVGYMSAPVGNIEFWHRQSSQSVSNPTDTLVHACGSDANSDCYNWTAVSGHEEKINSFLPVGTITEIPIHLSGIIRFRPESPFDPYIGVGFGYIVTDLQTSDEFDSTASIFSAPDFRVTVGDEGEFNVNNRCRRENGQACTDFAPGPLSAQVSDTWEWHAIGGIDYYMSDKFSVYVDARYFWTSGAVDIRTDGAHQVRFAVSDPGPIEIRQIGSVDQPYLWEDIGVPQNAAFHALCPQCQNNGTLETEDKNLNGALEPSCDVNGNGFCEDEGWLYQIPPGTRSIDESLRIACPACAHNYSIGPDGTAGTADDVGFDTEDANGNGYLDRYLLYGIDVCSTAQGVGNAACAARTDSTYGSGPPRYVWPEGCSQTKATLGTFSGLHETGCPPLIPASGSVQANPGTTVVDNSTDTYIIQGGRIRMGGFALGVGFKFTF